MQIIISTLVVFPAGYMPVGNYSPRESLPDSGAVSVFLKKWKQSSRKRVCDDTSHRLYFQYGRLTMF